MVLNDVNRNTCKVYSLTWSEYSSSLTATAQNLRNVEDLTDITISAGGKIFPAHKLVLSAASPLLMELLKNTKCQHPILMLAGITASDLEKILDFVYLGEINIDSEKLPSLLQAAQFLDIRALSPSALVLNSLQETHQVSTTANQEIKSDRNTSACKNLAVTNTVKTSEKSDLHFALPKRKRIQKPMKAAPLERKDISVTGECKKLFSSHNEVNKEDLPCENTLNTNSMLNSPKKSGELENHEVFAVIDEKKIISDLPVNCKLCGVTIRQSRNLRRHIDQRHSKQKIQKKQTDYKEKNPSNDKISVSSNIIVSKKVELNNNSNGPVLLNFSDDSFTQLTEEILSYSATTELSSNENSFSSSLAVSSTGIGNCLIDDIVQTSAHDSSSSSSTMSTSSSSSASIIQPQTLPTLLESDLCFPLPTTTAITTSTKTEVKSLPSDPCTHIENLGCANLEDTCNVNDMALKELENQLFSVCFCSAENEV